MDTYSERSWDRKVWPADSQPPVKYCSPEATSTQSFTESTKVDGFKKVASNPQGDGDKLTILYHATTPSFAKRT